MTSAEINKLWQQLKESGHSTGEGFDRDMFGFVVALVGMLACLIVSAFWSCAA